MYRLLAFATLFVLPTTLAAQPQVLLGKLLGTAQQYPQGQFSFRIDITSPDTSLTLDGTLLYRRGEGPAMEGPVTDMRLELEDGVYVFTPSGSWSYSSRTNKTYVDETNEELSEIFGFHLFNPLVWPTAVMLPMMGAADSVWLEPADACTFVRTAYSELDGLSSVDYCIDEDGRALRYEIRGAAETQSYFVTVVLANATFDVVPTDDDFTVPADVPVVMMGEAHRPAFVAVGEAPPAFTLQNADGEDVSLADYAGQVVLLDFWGVWCHTCVEAMPTLRTLHEQYGDELVILGISCYEDEDADPTAFARSKGLAYPILLNGETIADAYGVSAYPTYYVVGRDGTVRFATSPDYADDADEALHAALTAAVAE